MKESFSNSNEPINDYKRLHICSKIISYELINEDTILGNNYVLYNVNIFTYYKNWTVRKRYSEFEQLHKSLQMKINKELPEFPPKRLFKNSDSTIKERIQKLEVYLNFLFKNVNVSSYEEILEFIEIEKELLLLLMKNNSMIETNTSIAVKRYYNIKMGVQDNILKKAKSVDNLGFSNKENYYNSFLEYKLLDKTVCNFFSANMMVIEEFLRNLEFKSDNKFDIVKTFEQFLKGNKNWPIFKRDEISKLFYGDHNFYFGRLSDCSDNSNTSRINVKGLFHHVGNIEQNLFGAEICLEFIGKLINYEFNPDCDAYIFTLRTTNLELINSLRLEDHIKSNKRSIINTCFRILKVFLGDGKSMISKLDQIITCDEVKERFLFWLERNNDN